MDNIDESFFDAIDTPLKAYLLGLVLYNIKHNDNAKKTMIIEVSIDDNVRSLKHNHYFKNVDKLKKALSKLGECIYNLNNNNIVLTITSAKLIDSIHRHLNVHALSSICDLDITYLLDNMHDTMIYSQFVKAYIEKYGNITTTAQNDSSLHITFYLENNLEKLTSLFTIPHEKNKLFNLNIAVYHNVNVIDLMGLLYLDDTIPFMNLKLYDNFYKMLQNDDQETYIPRIRVYKDDDNAILPAKTRQSDVGYDITIIKESKRLNENTVLYDTGIKLDIPNGYYVEIVPRSSISKSGFMLANSIGIIDQSYRGNLYIALTKTSDDAKLELPCRCCQMIVKKQIYAKIVESTEDFATTNRGSGGFGSTGIQSICASVASSIASSVATSVASSVATV